jgi:hypothetical protein
VSAWLDENQRALSAELDRVAALLERRPEAVGERVEAPALGLVVEAFGLTPFERDLLLLCAGVELESRYRSLCAAAAGDERLDRPTFALALGLVPEPHWSALAPARPLRRWRLIELEPGEPVTTSPLRIDERVLHHLTGLSYADERLRAGPDLPATSAPLPPTQAATARRLAAAIAAATPAALLVGADAQTRRVVAERGAHEAGLRLFVTAASDLPAQAEERALIARLWEREVVLSRGVLLIEVDDESDPEVQRRLSAFAGEIQTGVLVGSADVVRLDRKPSVRIDVTRPTRAEQHVYWHELVSELGASPNGSLDALTAQFDLPLHAIASASTEATSTGEPLLPALWQACRSQARPRLDDLAQRIEALADWHDLVLPPLQLGTLRAIAAQVRRRRRVYEDWGFAAKSARGLGISALFEGPSGTGKTMAAEVLAHDLDLDLYRIDLSQVVSKYIGETEKNLRRVFDAAETGGLVLLFDEADALFGKRTQVRDSHDRYANIEVGYLLQRMEAYRGLAILTTNARDAVDDAFMRRLRFIVRFPVPDAAQRAEIWRRVFPAETPTTELDVNALAQLSLTGGTIRNIALQAAFIAAEDGDPVAMPHLAQAALRECAKLDRPLGAAEVAAWG